MGVMGITLMPFNLLHHHHEDEHVAYLHQHDDYKEHHCELDNNFCEANEIENCHHTHHLQKNIPDCFVCDIHFVKHYELPNNFIDTGRQFTQLLFGLPHNPKIYVSILSFGNRGPPLS
jgi:hypothetical protein